ncbi:hypothetical protein BX611_2330 [Lutibacter oceani]|uniref:Uncharacterized protein n=1 Tax=Lutibacter oceani TaxID=1853311 RepID=A0A3D9RLC1_9FLAO|nr:hypothetical protein [Lutibacter oceani]REE80680.1 hypothetical protein BX611_2330 [Lutibacter oceani]
MGFIPILLVVLIAIGFLRKTTPELQGHWNTLIDEFEYSTKDFYALLEKELKSHGIENITVVEREMSEGNALSTKRLYLRVSWKNYNYDCCCAPFGNGTFFSWWMFTERKDIEGLIYKIPFIGRFLANFFFPTTYYKIDSTSMFRSYAQASVLKVIDEITKEKGIRLLNDSERKPTMKDIFKR